MRRIWYSVAVVLWLFTGRRLPSRLYYHYWSTSGLPYFLSVSDEAAMDAECERLALIDKAGVLS